ncbi:MAG: hypothetical protein CGU28_13035 [Candidatus Dactylopiibacterium carminicum]|uniref:Uncharacterized protein n=1 Tax=Candidatus Dactylopiibacterium carminicum TaxID=857335 RepID=A0A272EPC8_9RHOO|nr:hypothetical protein [Candidatus Dactylopiibacterium carminicum]KAF7598253.1 hypothetical protein BGI27_14215 [Candidatus Dactylopiibacterium carminicum]PAS91947.1 MAG: hypothetical protein CGU29_13815 [Candidatus Dactylopiibacterium carminicum]PAS94990.1 MAG: hypothetical protein CGU28_13035 [Candidatus Dactylopiibacterium carminicum]PAS97136.1 MAG: hypothetical protein BSR46_14245 [Candidatus Dactylopiibacterium carminicum]
MHPVHDADALLLLALVLASKRHPATLEETIIALHSVRPELPGGVRLREAFARLSAHGLIQPNEAGYTLTAAAETLLSQVPVRGELDNRLFEIKRALIDLEPVAGIEPIRLESQRVTEAVQAFRASLPPPTKSERFAARPGKQSRPVRRR